jgi:hypothetical protein
MREEIVRNPERGCAVLLLTNPGATPQGCAFEKRAGLTLANAFSVSPPTSSLYFSFAALLEQAGRHVPDDERNQRTRLDY